MILPEPINSIQAQIDAYHESKQDEPRPYMGASILGHPCDRWLWLNFRWVIQQKFPGRIKRLFRRGQNEEATIIQDLRAIGMDVRGAQTAVKFDGYVQGHMDAIIASGVPDAPKKAHVAEFKTHNKKSFDDLTKNGVEKSKFEHFVQMQIYMLGTDIEQALYVAVCKDDDRMYTERVKLDKDLAKKYVKRGQRIAFSDRMPPPISTDPSWYQCKSCPAYNFCHQQELPKHFNCRTCAHSTASEEPESFVCEKFGGHEIPIEFQRKGCDSGTIHLDIVPWKYTAERDYIIWHTPDGDIAQGEPDANIYSASEVLANPKACATGAGEIRERFDGRVVG